METLKIDIDGCKFPGAEVLLGFLMAKRAWFLRRVHKRRVRFLGVCETTRGWHVKLAMQCKRGEVPFYQLVFFSDYKREIFNLKRGNDWNVFFACKYRLKGGSLNLVGKETHSWRCRLFEKAWQFWGEWHG